MLGNMSKKENQEERKRPLNKEDSKSLRLNRGVELLLRNKKRREPKPKTFQVKFGKIVSFFSREVDVFFQFHLDFRKKSSQGEE